MLEDFIELEEERTVNMTADSMSASVPNTEKTPGRPTRFEKYKNNTVNRHDITELDRYMMYNFPDDDGKDSLLRRTKLCCENTNIINILNL